MAAQPAYLKGQGRGRGQSRGQTIGQCWQKSSGESQISTRPVGRGQTVNASQSQQDKRSNESAADRFQNVVVQNQESLERHMMQYDSSSDEDEENIQDEEKILSTVVNAWQGKDQHVDLGNDTLGSTHDYLLSSMKSKGNSCIICIESIRKNDQIWSCVECGCMFHINCIQKWIQDGSYQQIRNDDDNSRLSEVPWQCPKCRHSYTQQDSPTRYYCFCGKTVDPEFDPWLIPHSCGQRCEKRLRPECGHRCLLLCHPGPCPPCPKTVTTSCYCGTSAGEVKRCSDKHWSCNRPCGKRLACGQHRCKTKCHSGECPVCPEVSIQSCVCGAETMERKCAEPVWRCQKVCGKPFSCGHHSCEQICHSGAECGGVDCPNDGQRFCPCGKTSFDLPCTKVAPTCREMCDKKLPCGRHKCEDKCHKGDCPRCRRTVKKQCPCGKSKKMQQCHQEYRCDVKCQRLRQCQNHMCNKKCCTGDCPPCELSCNKQLSCGNHRCQSQCHIGPCYPCRETHVLQCACGLTKITVPCGREKIVKPPKCKYECIKPPSCHHPKQKLHRCHFGACPDCSFICDKKLENCDHRCPENCHAHQTIKITHPSTHKRAGPWEPAPKDVVEIKVRPCPPCVTPIPVTCLGGHETTMVPCSGARVESCHSPCGQPLACGNHVCQIPCHLTKEQSKSGTSCESCEQQCSNPRPPGCSHKCLSFCHPGKCAPCKRYVCKNCHCGLIPQYIECHKWTSASEDYKPTLMCCPGNCTKKLSCGHQCFSQCHPPPCPDADDCPESVTLHCTCKRRSEQYTCNQVQSDNITVECDDKCLKVKMDKDEKENIKKRKEEEANLKRQQKELEEFERKHGGKKHKRQKRHRYVTDDRTFYQRHYKPIMCAIIAGLLAIIAYFIVNT